MKNYIVVSYGGGQTNPYIGSSLDDYSLQPSLQGTSVRVVSPQPVLWCSMSLW